MGCYGKSPIQDSKINILLKNALTNHINDRELQMKVIDTRYRYEKYHGVN